MPTIGSLCSGYGGLDLAVESALNARTAWVSDIDKGACKVLAHRFPDAPNIGDMTAVDWGSVEPVDILTGGTPCQDLSHAGKRAGMTEGTRSNLWVAMREAIAALRPNLVIWENVSGAYSAEADSELVTNPRLLADTRRRDGEPILRALGRVVGDLSSLGYVGSWHGLRASDVGAPHGRLRVFVVAHSPGMRGAKGELPRVRGRTDRRPSSAVSDQPSRGSVALLPTTRATDGTKGGPNQRGSSGDLMLPSAVAQLLPTPTTQDAANTGGPSQFDRNSRPLNTEVLLLPTGVRDWAQYAPAITRWEALTRPAPPPIQFGAKGNPLLSSAFTEWMMGLPAGWITDVPTITRNEALKLCGNGVVPQQAEHAIRFLLPLIPTEAVA